MSFRQMQNGYKLRRWSLRVEWLEERMMLDAVGSGSGDDVNPVGAAMGAIDDTAIVGRAEITNLLVRFGSSPDETGQYLDLDGDGIIGFRDLAILSIDYGRPLQLPTTYYVDADLGSDANDGTSAENAWKTIARVTAANFQRGDRMLFQRGDEWAGQLTVSSSGIALQKIVFSAYGEGPRPVLSRLTIDAHDTVFDELTIDRGKASGDAIRLRAPNVTLRNMEVRNGTSDGIDMVRADGALIDNLVIHHFLAGSFDNQADAHGIVASDTRGLTIRNTEIYQVSGDSFQADPDRDRTVTTDILIENSHFWTAPLETDFNDLWRAGETPGENAIDTKMVKQDWDDLPRMKITIRNFVAHGWKADGFISNRAVFNLKEKIDAVIDRVTVYDAEIAFRIRGTRGNANVTISNTVVYDVEKAIRAEDDLSNLKIYHSTFGDGIGTVVQFAGGSGGVASWDVRNNAFVSALPAIASDQSNRRATAADFVDSANRDYRLTGQSALVDAAMAMATIRYDRLGTTRPLGNGPDVGAFELVPNIAAALASRTVQFSLAATDHDKHPDRKECQHYRRRFGHGYAKAHLVHGDGVAGGTGG